MRKLWVFVAAMLAAFIISTISLAEAATETYTGTGEYIMDDDETLKHAIVF